MARRRRPQHEEKNKAEKKEKLSGRFDLITRRFISVDAIVMHIYWEWIWNLAFNWADTSKKKELRGKKKYFFLKRFSIVQQNLLFFHVPFSSFFFLWYLLEQHKPPFTSQHPPQPLMPMESFVLFVSPMSVKRNWQPDVIIIRQIDKFTDIFWQRLVSPACQ